MRYMTEDIPFGFVGLSQLGKVAGVPTPVIDSAIILGSTITKRDFWIQGRTLDKLGLGDMTKEEIINYVNTGFL
jgi:opine dehydrogenase